MIPDVTPNGVFYLPPTGWLTSFYNPPTLLFYNYLKVLTIVEMLVYYIDVDFDIQK